MRKKPLILEELIIWLRGRFTLTDEEKTWILMILVICWVGLAARYFYLKNQKPPEPAIPTQQKEVLRP
ncbi:MAG: hypothetical protein HOO88_00520 [Kiritimatiellaceae bacterium]|nr:hypothetical protein [Kiritimatiellaceae bacterium]